MTFTVTVTLRVTMTMSVTIRKIENGQLKTDNLNFLLDKAKITWDNSQSSLDKGPWEIQKLCWTNGCLKLCKTDIE